MSEQAGFDYDVFISYSHDDEAWVTGTLLPRLEEAGLRTCIDFRDFVAGKAALLNMQDAARNSRHTLLVLTKAWVESEWTLYESLLTRTKDPAGLQRRTVPLRLQACEIPEFISTLTWVDFTRPDRLEIAWTQLLTAVSAPPVQETPEPPTRAGWCLKHPYPMPPNFTGRTAEREMLSDWLAADAAHPLLAMRALGGFGKSALAWHWLLHDVDPARWPRVVWWGFYDDRNFESFLRETLEYLLKAGATHLRGATGLNPRQQADGLLHLLHRPGTLLILDGFERALRAYGSMDAAYQGDELGNTQYGTRDCVSPIAEYLLRCVACLPGLRSKALLTTRLRPRILETHGGDLLAGCREVELTRMQPADAVAFFRAQGVRGARAEIEAACAPYGYHPLSLRLLAGLIRRDPRQPGDVRAARHLDVSGDLVQRQHHVLETAYANLAPERQKLLSTVACFRGPVAQEALVQMVAQQQPAESKPRKPSFIDRLLGHRKQTPRVSESLEALGLDAALRELVDRGLLHHDRKAGKYDLHPIVRRYAYDRLGDRDRTNAHGQLRDYFAAVPPPERVQSLEDLAPVIELYHHTVRAGQYDEAFELMHGRLVQPIYFQFGAYQLCIELLRALFPDGEERPPRVETKRDQSWTANALANSYSLSGQPGRAVLLFQVSADLDESEGDKVNLAIDLGNLASMAQIYISALRAAEANLRRRIALCQEIKDEFEEAIGHQELGRLLAYHGAWAEAEKELAAALTLFKQQRQVQPQGVVWAYRAQRALLLARWSTLSGDPKSAIGNRQSAIDAARRALELADETARTRYPVERDYVNAYWLLGAAHRATGSSTGSEQALDAAERHLSEALTRCRGINLVEMEADILIELARLRHVQGHQEEALRLAEEALLITERSGYVLQGADVHLFLAEMALKQGDREAARDQAQKARELATCDGPPDYTYRVAYAEAGALLDRLQS